MVSCRFLYFFKFLLLGDSLVKDARTVSTEFGFLRVEEILSSDDQSDDDSADKQDECRKFTSGTAH